MNKKSETFKEPQASRTLTNAFRLHSRIRQNNRYHTVYTLITLTPRGKSKKHEDILKPFLTIAKSYKSIVDVFLIAETEQTEHFHGVIVSKSQSKFSKFYNKKNPFQFYISKETPIGTFIKYIVKHNPNTVYTLNEVLKFNQIFKTDNSIPMVPM